MKKFLIVNTEVDFIDRRDIRTNDIVICRSPDNQPCICIWVEGLSEWQIWDTDNAKVVAHTSIFADFFSLANSTGQPLKGWKFYKLSV